MFMSHVHVYARRAILLRGAAIRCWTTAGYDVTEALSDRPGSHWIGHGDRVASVAWSGGRLFSGGYDGRVIAWARRGRGGLGHAWEEHASFALDDAPGERVLALAVGRRRRATAGHVVLCGTSSSRVVALRSTDLRVR